MKFHCTLLLFLLCLFCFACFPESDKTYEGADFNKNKSDALIDTTRDSIIKLPDGVIAFIQNDSTYKYVHKLVYKKYLLKVHTYCQNDSVPPEKGPVFNPIVKRQDLLFFRNDTLIKQITLPFRKVKFKVYSGKLKEMNEALIIEAKIIKVHSLEPFYYCWGYDGTNSPHGPTYHVIYTLAGELLAIDYTAQPSVISRQGDLKLLEEVRKRKEGQEISSIFLHIINVGPLSLE